MESSRKIDALIIGANGLVGGALAKKLSKCGYRWLGTSCKRENKNLRKLNIVNEPEPRLDQLCSEVLPAAIFHCANLSGGVDLCERQPERAYDFHVKATQLLGRHAQRTGAIFFFISTDYIFDGSKGDYREDDSPHPLNVYGMLKLEAEKWIQENLDRYVILRTTNVYGWDPETMTPNYVMNLYRCLKEGKTFHAPSYLFGSPTYAPDLASAMIELFEKKITGIFHVVGSDYADRYTWAVQAAKHLDLEGSLIKEQIHPAVSIALRPQGVRLNTEKFRNRCVTRLHNLTEGLLLLKDALR
ncbi:MAG: SDR family oxidoreductase [Deltaproteobacteria bacterium]